MKPRNTQEPIQRSTQQAKIAGSSANLTKADQYPTRYTIVKDTIILHIAIPQAASSQHTRVARIQGCGHMHPVIRRPATQYMHRPPQPAEVVVAT